MLLGYSIQWLIMWLHLKKQVDRPDQVDAVRVLWELTRTWYDSGLHLNLLVLPHKLLVGRTYNITCITSLTDTKNAKRDEVALADGGAWGQGKH